MTLRVAVLFSGGKDSTYASWVGQHQGWDLSLITVRPTSPDSRMFHYPNVEWTHLQAQAMGLSHEVVEMMGMDELADLQHALLRMKSQDEIPVSPLVRSRVIIRNPGSTTCAMRSD